MVFKEEQSDGGQIDLEMMAFYFILFTTSLIIIYCIIMAIVKKLNTNLFTPAYLEKQMLLKLQEETYEEIQVEIKNAADEHLETASKILFRIDDALIQIYVLTSLYVLLCGMILISFCAYFFMPNSKTALSCIFGFMYGVVAVCIITYITIKFTTCANGKIMFTTFEDKGKGTKFAYLVGNCVSLFSLSLVFLIFNLFIYFTHMTWNVDSETGEKMLMTIKMFENMTHSIIGYSLGICFASLFYREITGQCSRGIVIGVELIGKLDRTTEEDRNIDKNLQMAMIICNTLTNNLVQTLDNITVTTSLLCSTLILLCQTPQISQEGLVVNPYHILFYSYMIFLIVFMLISAWVSWIFQSSDANHSEDYNDDTSQSLAFGVRIQIIIQKIVAIILILLLPRYIFPRSIDIGTESDIFHSSQITHGDMIWCLLMGLILQTCIVIYSEYNTSHYFGPTREAAIMTRENFGYGLIGVFIYGSYSYFFMTIIFGVFIFFSYAIAGFFGISLCGLGLVYFYNQYFEQICSQMLYMTVNIMGGICCDGYKFSKVTNSYGTVIDRLYRFSWASKSFTVFSQILNTGGVFLVNIVCIGSILVLSKVTQIWLWSGFTLFGFFIGSAIAYFLKGGSISIIKAVALGTFKEYRYFEGQDQSINERNIDKPNNLTQFIENKYNTGILRVIISSLVCIVSILLVGILLGGESIFGYILGLNVVGIQISIFQIIIGNQIKSIKDYNENELTDNNNRKGQYNTSEMYMYALSIENLPGSALISYLAFNTMFVLLGSAGFGRSGKLREYIEQYVSYTPEEEVGGNTIEEQTEQ